VILFESERKASKLFLVPMKFSKTQNLEEPMILAKMPKASQQANSQQRPPPPTSQIPDLVIFIQKHNNMAIRMRMPISRLGKSFITRKGVKRL